MGFLTSTPSFEGHTTIAQINGMHFYTLFYSNACQCIEFANIYTKFFQSIYVLSTKRD